LFLVLLSYACKEALKIAWKLEVEEDAVGGSETWDMGCSGGLDGKLMGASHKQTVTVLDTYSRPLPIIEPAQDHHDADANVYRLNYRKS
jgi:hypothetical protein